MTLSVPATFEGVRKAMAACELWCDKGGVAIPQRRRVMTALDEVLSNVVRHGARTPFGEIDVSFAGAPGAVLVEVTDDGAAFDPLSLPAPDTSAPLEQRTVGGLGIALVRALADDVAYDRRDGRNHLVMTWRTAS